MKGEFIYYIMTDKYQFTTDMNLLVTICIHKNNPNHIVDGAYFVDWATNREPIVQGSIWLDYDTKTIVNYDGVMPKSVKKKLLELGWEFSILLKMRVQR